MVRVRSNSCGTIFLWIPAWKDSLLFYFHKWSHGYVFILITYTMYLNTVSVKHKIIMRRYFRKSWLPCETRVRAKIRAYVVQHGLQPLWWLKQYTIELLWWIRQWENKSVWRFRGNMKKALGPDSGHVKSVHQLSNMCFKNKLVKLQFHFACNSCTTSSTLRNVTYTHTSKRRRKNTIICSYATSDRS